MSVALIVLLVCNSGGPAGTGGRQFGPSMGVGRAAAWWPVGSGFEPRGWAVTPTVGEIAGDLVGGRPNRME